MNRHDVPASFGLFEEYRRRLMGTRVDFNAEQAADCSQEADRSVDRRDGGVEPSFLDLLNLIVAADASQPLGTRLDAPLLRFAIDGNQTELWTVTE